MSKYFRERERERACKVILRSYLGMAEVPFLYRLLGYNRSLVKQCGLRKKFGYRTNGHDRFKVMFQ